MDDLTGKVKDIALKSGAALCGIADLTIIPTELRQGLTRGVSFAVAYEDDIIEGIKDGPSAKYEAAYNNLNCLLNQIASGIREFLRSQGFRATAFRATTDSPMSDTDEKDFQPLSEIKVELPHKTIATLAGLGWIGKTDLLVNECYGPRIRLGTVLTDAPLTPDEPILESGCGDCALCITGCPVDAGRPDAWDATSRKTYIVERCYDYTKLISSAEGLGAQLCGICIASCPIRKKLKN